MSTYRNLERIHEGGRSVVFRGIRSHDGAKVIVKQARTPWPPPDEVALLRREFDLSRSATGPMVVAANCFTAKDGIVRLEFEDFGGISLARFMASGRTRIPQALEILAQCALALAHVHERGIVHKDISPGNIIINTTTGAVKLADFGLSSRIAAHTTGKARFEGTPAYMSPEQTGRMNRAVDHRSDLYSLGAVAYSLLTGRPPFVNTDALELVHAHIAREPEPLHAIDRRVPPALSAIVLTLLSKRAEDRYQSATGLVQDLDRCRTALRESGSIAPFPLREGDLVQTLHVSDHLYGREEQQARLNETLQRVVNGATELVVVDGEPGIGKTSVVLELQREMVRHRALFLTGKFEQFRSGQPYAALTQALAQAMGQLLSGADSALRVWRERLRVGVGRNGRLLTDLVPTAEAVIGRQAPLDEVGPNEAENRASLVLRRTIAALGGRGRPLILFLDDLQWADVASLRLLEALLQDPDQSHLMLIVSYRTTEVDATHPVQASLDRIRDGGGHPQHLPLGPLSSGHVRALLADTLGRAPSEVEALAAQITERTGGNPFFVRSFLGDLSERGALFFDPKRRAWSWDLTKLRQAGVTENVVDLMAARFHELPAETVKTLQVAGCMGNTFQLGELASVRGLSRHETQKQLEIVIGRSLVVPREEAYWFDDFEALPDEEIPDFRLGFVHDRVEQAAHESLGESDSRALHLRLGRHLRATLDAEQQQERIFDLVSHFSAAHTLITDDEERQAVIDLMLYAGVRALDSAAHGPALELLGIGVSLTIESDWTDAGERTRELHLKCATAAWLAGDEERLNALVEAAVAQSSSPEQAAQARLVQVQALVSGNKLMEGIDAAIDALATIDFELPKRPEWPEVDTWAGETLGALAAMTDAEILELPELDDERVGTALRLHNAIASAAYLAVPPLLPILACSSVLTTLRQGVAPQSVYGLTLVGLVVTAQGMLDQTQRIAHLTRGLLARLPQRGFRPKPTHILHGFLEAWSLPLRESINRELDVYELGMEAGDIEYAEWGTHLGLSNAFYAGLELPWLENELGRGVASMTRNVQMPILFCTIPFLHTVRALRGLSSDPSRMEAPDFEEDTFLAQLRSIPFDGAIYIVGAMQVLLRYLFDTAESAVERADATASSAAGAAATYHIVLFKWAEALARLKLAGQGDDTQLEPAKALTAQFDAWAAGLPQNFAQKSALLRAEIARVEGDPLAALESYDEAIELARARGWSLDEAMANELAGRFHLGRGSQTVGRAYLLESIYAWQRWGAHARVRSLEQEFPDLLAPQEAGALLLPGITASVTSSGRVTDGLDIASLFKASAAIAKEIRLDILLSRVVEVAIESAGATRGALLRERDGDIWLDAVHDVAGEEGTACDVRLKDSTLPQSVVNFVRRTGETLIIGDATRDRRFSDDPALPDNRPLSVLCLPVAHQGERRAILYMENDLTSRAFTAARAEVVGYLGRQAAISIENARLYEEAEASARSFARFVPSGMMAPLGRERVVDLQLGDAVSCNSGVLFCDLRGFTALFESLSASEGFALLNEYLGRATPTIIANGGLVDKFVGDAIMALFLESTDGALRAALGIQDAADQLSRLGVLPGGGVLRAGCGIHAGPVTLGTVGSDTRLDVTAIGDTVNLAARLEGATKSLRCSTLISSEVVARLAAPEAFELRRLGPVQVYGRQETVEVYEFFGADPADVIEAKKKTMARFSDALEAMREGGDSVATALLRECVELCPSDGPAQALLERIRSGVGANGKGDLIFVREP